MLEARSATAQAEYDLQAILGAEEIARGDLATAIGASATTVIQVQSLDQIPSRESIGDTVDQTINRALEQRPDLMQQVAQDPIRKCTSPGSACSILPSINPECNPGHPITLRLTVPISLVSHC